MKALSLQKLKNNSLLIISLLAYLLLSLIQITQMGLQYDEVLFVNAALGNHSSFVVRKIFNIPIFVMNYIGALKSWLYFLIFKLFGTSVITVRLPVIFITLISLILLHKFLKQFFSRKVANITLLLLATNPIFIYLTRFDVGPNALEFIFKVSGLFLAGIYLKSKRKLHFVLSILSFYLGVFNKLNFIWWVIAIIGGILTYLIINLKKSKRFILKQDLKIFLLALLTLVLLTLSYTKTFTSSSQELAFKEVFTRTERVFINLQSFLNYSLTLTYFFENPDYPSILKFAFHFYLAIIILGTILGIKSKKHRSLTIILWVVNILILAQIVLSKRANAPWHMFFLYPNLTILSAYLITLFPKKIFTSLLTILVGFNSLGYYYHYKALKENKITTMWSNKIFELAEYTKKTNKKFVITDWGITNQLFLLDPIKGKYFDHWVFFHGLDNIDLKTKEFIASEFLKENTYFISHGKETLNFKETLPNFIKFINSFGYSANITLRLKDQKNRIIFIVYKLVDS